MRGFIFKAIIVTFIFIIGVVSVFEFTIGKSIDKFSNKQGREVLINKLRKEMKKGVDKEYMLKEEDRVLIYDFFNKLIKEINTVEKN